jgi:hypothetical protein
LWHFFKKNVEKLRILCGMKKFSTHHDNFILIILCSWKPGLILQPIIYLHVQNNCWFSICLFLNRNFTSTTYFLSRVKYIVGPLTCSAVSNRFINLKTRHLAPRTCKPVHLRSNPVLYGGLAWVLQHWWCQRWHPALLFNLWNWYLFIRSSKYKK